MFEPEIKSQGLTLSGRWEAAGPMALKQLNSGAGWLVMAWTQNDTHTAAGKQLSGERK